MENKIIKNKNQKKKKKKKKKKPKTKKPKTFPINLSFVSCVPSTSQQ